MWSYIGKFCNGRPNYLYFLFESNFLLIKYVLSEISAHQGEIRRINVIYGTLGGEAGFHVTFHIKETFSSEKESRING